MNEVIVRKPKAFKFFGLEKVYNKYTNRYDKWKQLFPNNGDHIKITWFPDNSGVTNAYIGWEGVVENVNKVNGTFDINSGNAILVCSRDFNYIKL